MSPNTCIIGAGLGICLAMGIVGGRIRSGLDHQTSALLMLVAENKPPIIVNATVGLDASTKQLFDDVQRPAKHTQHKEGK